MSKSLGNFYTARDVFQGRIKVDINSDELSGKPVAPAVLRYELIKTHYRKNMNFTYKGLLDSARTVQRIVDFRMDLESKTNGEASEVDLSHPILKQFSEALADDLNMAGALGVVIPWVRGDHPDPHESLAVWKKINSVLSIAPVNEGIAEAVSDSSGDDEYAEADQWCKDLDNACLLYTSDAADE